ncbi:MAG: YciI family protein [Ktedonobacteraceae bacterium]
MRYLLLIYQDEVSHTQWSEEQLAAEYQVYSTLGDEFQKLGAEMQGGEALMPTNSATTVRVRAGKTLTTDGPFAETKEQLGGFYLLNCKDLDEAIKLAAKIPAATDGSIEIRPIMEFS